MFVSRKELQKIMDELTYLRQKVSEFEREISYAKQMLLMLYLMQ